jgi:hypothetical protein
MNFYELYSRIILYIELYCQCFELPHQKYKQKIIDASYKNLNEIILIIT